MKLTRKPDNQRKIAAVMFGCQANLWTGVTFMNGAIWEPVPAGASKAASLLKSIMDISTNTVFHMTGMP
jgi:hypothetical protein